jgi:signal transduction histidine kinase
MSRQPNAAHFPRRTVRLRLTLLYGGMFVASGAVLLTVANFLVRQATNFVFVQRTDGSGTTGIAGVGSGAIPDLPPQGAGDPGFDSQQQAQQVLNQVGKRHVVAMHQLLVQSFILLAIMSVISIWLGWLVAGRALRPLRLRTATAREISSTSLHERLALSGPDDELKELGDTFDALIARLERSFQSQRQFVANASHELRTPLTLQHALLEAALLDPNATLQSWRTTGERALAASREQERLIAALLILARSDRGLSRREPFDLSAVTASVLAGRQADFDERGLRLAANLEVAPTLGDPALAARLVANLIDNAVRHNVPEGRVDVVTDVRNGHAVLAVRNTGPLVGAGEVDRLFEPFQRADGERTSHDGGLGLGLSIVQAIAAAHGATITAHPLPTGGLSVIVGFPLAATQPGHGAAAVTAEVAS